MKKPKVSVIYLTNNRKKDILKHIGLLKNQAFKDFEIILVDNDSTDGTREEVSKKFPRVRIIHNRPGIGRAGHNKGMEAARGKILVTIDSDMYLNNDTLERIVDKFEKFPSLMIVPIRMIVTQSGEHQVPPYLSAGDSKEGFPSLFGGGMVAMRKEVFEKAGGWDPFLFLYAEEWEYHVRLWRHGFMARYFPDIFAYHTETPSKFRSQLKGYLIARNWLVMYMLFIPFRLWPKFLRHHLGQFGKVMVSGVENRKGSILGVFSGIRDMLTVIHKRWPLEGELLERFLTFYFPQKGRVVVEQLGWKLEKQL